MLCPSCGTSCSRDAFSCSGCGTVLRTPGTPVQVPEQSDGPRSDVAYQQQARRRLAGLGAVAAILLGISAFGCVAAIIFPGATGLAELACLPTGILCLIWFVRARVNAEHTEWRQPLSTPWAFWGWVVPVISLWFPCEIMTGIWRASQPAQDRGRPMGLVGAWWACWLLAWNTIWLIPAWSIITETPAVSARVAGALAAAGSSRIEPSGTAMATVVGSSPGYWLEDARISKGFAALAGILLAVIIWQVSRRRAAARGSA